LVVKEVLDFIGRAALVAACPSYRQGGWMKKVEEAVASHLQASSAEQPEWRPALDIYEGLDSLPLMTITRATVHRRRPAVPAQQRGSEFGGNKR
jgi:hypothetical protein